MINSKFLLPIFIILTCKLSGFICSLHFTSQSCFPYSHAVVNWSPSQHPVIIMASFSSNCLEILSEYVWHSELLPLRFTWVNILFKIFHFYIVSETNNWCPLPTLQHLKDYLPVPPAVSHQQVKTRIYYKGKMFDGIQDSWFSKEYRVLKREKILQTCLLWILLSCVYGSTVRSISRFHKERSQDLNQFKWLCGHSPATSPEGIHRSERGNIIKTESSASQTCAPAHCNCTFMKKVDGP